MATGWYGVFAALEEALAPSGGAAWLVGGCLRDWQFGERVVDIDLVTTADPLTLAQRLCERVGAQVATLPRSVRISLPQPDESAPLQLDLTALGDATIEENLRDRDFTINAMALPVRGLPAVVAPPTPTGALATAADLIDPTGGRADLLARSLRPAGKDAFRNDPGRILRGARFVARYGLTPADETVALARDASLLLPDLSPNRLRDELNALLAAPGCGDGLAFLDQAGALLPLFPALARPGALAHALASVRWTARLQEPEDEAPDEARAFSRATAVGRWYATRLSDGVPRVVALRWGLLLHAALPHDEGLDPAPRAEPKPRVAATQRVLAGPERRIAYEIEARASFVARAIGLGEPDERDQRRLFDATGEVTVDVLVAAAACAMGLAAQGRSRENESQIVVGRVGAILDRYFTEPERLIPPPLLTGHDLIDGLGMSPGSEIHRLLARVREAQIDGMIASRAEALALAKELLSDP